MAGRNCAEYARSSEAKLVESLRLRPAGRRARKGSKYKRQDAYKKVQEGCATTARAAVASGCPTTMITDLEYHAHDHEHEAGTEVLPQVGL